MIVHVHASHMQAETSILEERFYAPAPAPPRGGGVKKLCLNSSTCAVSEIVSRRWWCIEYMFLMLSWMRICKYLLSWARSVCVCVCVCVRLRLCAIAQVFATLWTVSRPGGTGLDDILIAGDCSWHRSRHRRRHAWTCGYIPALSRALPHTYIPTYLHTYIHTYIPTQILTHSLTRSLTHSLTHSLTDERTDAGRTHAPTDARAHRKHWKHWTPWTHDMQVHAGFVCYDTMYR